MARPGLVRRSAGGPEGSGRKVWGPPKFFFFLLATRRKHREGEVRLTQGLNPFGALRVRVKQKRREKDRLLLLEDQRGCRSFA